MNYKEFINLAFQDHEYRSVMESKKIEFLSSIACDILDKDIDGDVVECGVYRGGSARLLATIFPHKKIFLFDSFCGFIKNDLIKNQFQIGSFSDTSIDEVKSYLSDKENCIFCPGWLPESANTFISTPLSFVYMDMDYYESTVKSLEIFWPMVKTGGVIVFDDWEESCCPGIKIAINDFFSEYEAVIDGNMCAIYKN